MKIPRTFVPEKDLESKTEGLLTPKKAKKKDVAFTDYTQVWYSTEGTAWVIEYEKRKSMSKWVVYDKEFGEQKWFESKGLGELAENILKNRINPLVELLNLKEKDYSIEKDNFKAILNRYAIKIFEGKEFVEDKEHGKCKISLYEKGNLTIELKEFDKIKIGRIDILDES